MRKRCIALLLCLLTLAALTGCGESSAKAVTSNGVECYRVDGVCYPAVFGEPQLTGEEITALLDKEREEVVEERRRDYKTELQELVQRRSGQVLHYELTGTSGPDHAKQFTFRVTLNGRELGQGTGRSKKEAEQSAARSALTQWNEQ